MSANCDKFINFYNGIFEKQINYQPSCEGGITFMVLLYKNSTDYYAKIYTDTAIFKPIKITSEVRSLIDKKLFKKICYNKRERANEVFPGSAAYAEESALYWDFKDTYYFVYGNRYHDECLNARDKKICDQRNEFFKKLKSYILEEIQNAEFEIYHQWEVGD